MSEGKSFRKYLLSIAAVLSFAAIAEAQTYSGQGFAGSVKVSLVGQPVVTTNVLDTGDLPVMGGTVTQSRLANYTLPGGVLTLGDRTVSTSGAANSSATSSSVNGVNIGALGFLNLVTAGVVSANTSATCPGTVLTANSSVASLNVSGIGAVAVLPNQFVEVTSLLAGNRLLRVRVNERIQHPGSITANALHITVEDPTAFNLVLVDVIVVSARSGINCGIAMENDLYSGRGTAVRVDQNSLLIPFLSTIAADTGWLPSSGTFPSGPIESTTAGADVAGIVTTGAVFSSTEGGDPEGTTESSSEVNTLGVNVPNPLFFGPANVLTLGADTVASNTRCQCSLAAPTCTGDSDIVGLSATALGLPVNVDVDFDPNTELINVNIPLIARVRIVVNEQSNHTMGLTYKAIDVTALRIQIEALADLLVDTDIKIADSHSDIACGAPTSAAPATLSGRVIDRNGRAISRATVTAMDSNGRARFGSSNSFGYYSIKDLSAGESYIVAAAARGYTFSARSVSLDDNIAGFDMYPDVRQTEKTVAADSEPSEKLVKEASPDRQPARGFYKSVSMFDLDTPSTRKLKILQ